MSEWSLRLQTPTSQLTAQLPHGATIKVLNHCPAAAAPVVTADPPTIDLLGP